MFVVIAETLGCVVMLHKCMGGLAQFCWVFKVHFSVDACFEEVILLVTSIRSAEQLLFLVCMYTVYKKLIISIYIYCPMSCSCFE